MGNMNEMPGGPPMESTTTKSNYADINWVDVHGAGAQRSEFKAGGPAEYSEGHGPQGDAIRIYNYVRLVRDVK